MRTLKVSEDVELDLDNIVGKFIAILGIRGSGKTNTSSVILEELLRYSFPLTIVDIDGEYWGLREKYEVLVIGKSENVDIEIDIENAEQIAEVSISRDIPVILDVSGFLLEDTYKLLLSYFKRIWDLAGKYRKPYEIILEEAHEFIPQGTKTDLKEILVRIALRGRKRGLGAIILSQRSARVEKDVLTQAEILFLHKVVHPSDFKVYKEILPFPSNEVVNLVSSLNVGECIFYYGETCKPIKIKRRETFHAGYTPTLKEVKSPTLKKINEGIIKEIKELTKAKKQRKNKVEELEQAISDLKNKLEEREKTINQLQEELETLRKIKVEVEPSRIFPMRDNASTSTEEETKNGSETVENELSFEELPKEVKEHAKTVLKRVNSLNKAEKEMFRFLLIREPEEYTYNQIAEWTGYSQSTLYSNTPSKLIKIGLIKRSRKRDGYHFWSDFDSFIKREFSVYYHKIGDAGLKVINDHLRSNII